MLRFTTGDMFETPADIRVNTVNCVGVMGAGVALAFKERYPEMFRDYQKACKAGHVQPGKLHVWKKSAADWVINFPTKRHWREKSRYEDIELGLVALREYLSRQGKVRLNLPALGCGHGGLDWERVSAMIREKLDGLEADITVFDPSYSKNVIATVSRNGVTTASLRPNDAEFPTAFSNLGIEQVSYQGEISLFSESAIALAFSQKPTEKELAATLDFITQLARPGLVFSFTMGTAAATQYAQAVLQSGARLAAWVAAGLVNYQTSRSVAALSTGKNLLLLSLAPASQRWNPQLARRSTLAALLTSRVGLLTDPDPKWLFAMPLEERAVLRQPLFYVRYQNSDNRLKQRLAEISARAIGKNSADGKPNIAPIVEILSRAHSQPAEVIPPVVFTSPATLALNETHSIPVQTSAPTPETVSMTRYPKRLIEVDLPIKRISAHARREKSIRHGHISTLHIWWARRPLAACRAVICAALWPDPADENCPAAFIKIARAEMQEWTTHERQALLSVESRSNFESLRKNPNDSVDLVHLRALLLDFIADFANWDSSTVPEFLATSRALTQAAHEALGGAPGTRPLVVDPFCGGGSIPLEALRVGADAFASDLNPIPVLLNKVVLEYIPKYGQRLADEVRKWGEWIKREAEKELAEFYPKDADGATPIAYLWARTILSEAPDQGQIPIEVPLMRSLWLAKKKGRNRALRWKRDANGNIQTVIVEVLFASGTRRKVRRPLVEVFEPKSEAEVEQGPSRAGAATCPISGFTTSVESVRRQLVERTGGASDARLMCVVIVNDEAKGRVYRLPTELDVQAAGRAAQALLRRLPTQVDGFSQIPDGKLNHLRGFFNIVLYGMTTWGDLFSPRQKLTLTTLNQFVHKAGEHIANESEKGLADAVQTCLGLAVSRHADINASLGMWHNTRELITHVFGRQALPMVWDFAEANTFCESSGAFLGGVDWISRVLEQPIETIGHVEQASATEHPLPEDAADLIFTDPPYYAAIPYADLSDFFYSWLRRALIDVHPDLFRTELSPKEKECVSLSHRAAMYRNKDSAWFESMMTDACREARRVDKSTGIGVFVFANKETSGWEAMLAALISSGWIITGSWPIDTEMGNRLRARNSAALASSIHLVCRPRENPDSSVRTNEIGDWRDVLQALPIRIHEWMPRLAEEGVVGADAIFACLGPALEIFSRYSRVEKASGEKVTLKEYLEQVWAAVAKEALALVFKDADTTGFEADARLTAMWLWTLNAGNTDTPNGESTEDDDADDESEGGSKKTKATGFVLEFDAARKIAQGLGANLENLGSLVEVTGEQARLLPVGERARHLFGKDEGQVTTARKKKVPQLDLFKVLEQADDGGTTFGETKVEHHGETVLDRIHQSMILFAAGRSEAMKRFLVEDGAGRDPRFWRLAQALSALYPSHTEEKRWVDGVLARKKGLGF